LIASASGSMGERYKQLAAELGVSVRTVYRWGRGDSVPSDEHQNKLVEMSRKARND